MIKTIQSNTHRHYFAHATMSIKPCRDVQFVLGSATSSPASRMRDPNARSQLLSRDRLRRKAAARNLSLGRSSFKIAAGQKRAITINGLKASERAGRKAEAVVRVARAADRAGRGAAASTELAPAITDVSGRHALPTTDSSRSPFAKVLNVNAGVPARTRKRHCCAAVAQTGYRC